MLIQSFEGLKKCTKKLIIFYVKFLTRLKKMPNYKLSYLLIFCDVLIPNAHVTLEKIINYNLS
jgi:hypothetical protein